MTTQLGDRVGVVLVVGLEVGVLARPSGRTGRTLRGVEADRPLDRLRVRVEQELGRVEAVPALGLVRAVHAVGVALARADEREVAVPVERGALAAARCAPRCPSSSNRHSSTRVAFSEKMEKFVPPPSQVAPSGNGSPGQTSLTGPPPRRAAPSAPSRTSPAASSGLAVQRPALLAEVGHDPVRPAPDGQAAAVDLRLGLGVDGQLGAQAEGGARPRRAGPRGSPLARELGALEGRRVLRVGDLLAERRRRPRTRAAAPPGSPWRSPRRCGRRRTGRARARRTPRPGRASA